MKENVIKKIAVTAASLTIAIALCSCGGTSSIVGVWEGNGETIEFFDDGTLTFEGMDGSYSISDGNRLKIQVLWASYGFDYDISGDTLTLTTDDGSTQTYTRYED